MSARMAAPLLALALGFGLAAAPVSAQEDGQRPSQRRAATIQLVGNGFGHGHGMSQYGAQSRASAGQSRQQILSFYYPGVQAGRAGGNISVLISGDRTREVMVAARSGLTVAQVDGPKKVKLSAAKPTATRWRIVPLPGRSRVDFFRSSWRTLTTLKGPAEFSAAGKPVTLFVTAKLRVAYRGKLQAIGGDTVNVLPLDDYLKGVVPREVPASWKPAAVQAQAVAARTYAAFERREPQAAHYEICDTTACQVYGGYTDEEEGSNRAIAATAKQILTSGGQPAFTQFSASNGGWTSAGGFSYLPAKADPFDTVYRGWTDSVTAAEVQHAYPALGTFQSAEVMSRDGNGQWGGRVVTIRLVGAKTSTTIGGESFRDVFGLNSTWFRIA
jgi:stage II sporulation protein D